MNRCSLFLALAALSAASIARAEGPASAPAPDSSPLLADDFLQSFTTLATPQRAYKPLRFDEDWRWLKNPHADHDPFDPIKYIPLTDNGDLSLSLGGSVRARFEDKFNPGFGATTAASPTANDDYFLYRTYLHADLRYRDLLRLFVEGDFAYIEGWRRNPPPTPFPSDDADIHQAFVDFSPFTKAANGFGLTLRAGRQELLYDKQKLVGTLDWANVRRTFDGVKLIATWEDFKAEAFWTRPVVIDPKRFDSTDEQTNFSGINISHPLYGKDHTASLFVYYLNRNRDTASSFTAPATAEFNPDLQKGDTDRVTIGGHVWGAFGPLDYDAEGGVQVGREAANDILAGYISTELGYTFADAWSKPRLSVGYDYASGDDKRGDGKSNTFDQLFPTGHLWLGYLDFVGRQNVDAGNVTLTLNPTKELKLWGTWHTFCLASPNDALYNASGQAIRFSPTGSAGTYVGNELDLTGSYQLGRHTSFLFGYGVFFPGDFINNTGKSETAQMVYASVEYKF